MRRIVVVSSLGIVLVPLLVTSAAWLPSSTIEQERTPGFVATMPEARPAAFVPQRPSSANPAPEASAPTAQLAQVDWKPLPTEIPGLGTILAGACLLLPFALSMWGTLRKDA